MSNLKSCPFCGSKFVESVHHTCYSIDSDFDTFGCTSCGASFIGGSELEWNQRVSPTGIEVEKFAAKMLNSCAYLKQGEIVYDVEKARKMLEMFYNEKEGR